MDSWPELLDYYKAVLSTKTRDGKNDHDAAAAQLGLSRVAGLTYIIQLSLAKRACMRYPKEPAVYGSTALVMRSPHADEGALYWRPVFKHPGRRFAVTYDDDAESVAGDALRSWLPATTGNEEAQEPAAKRIKIEDGTASPGNVAGASSGWSNDKQVDLEAEVEFFRLFIDEQRQNRNRAFPDPEEPAIDPDLADIDGDSFFDREFPRE